MRVRGLTLPEVMIDVMIDLSIRDPLAVPGMIQGKAVWHARVG
jgi:hypothetical protein